MSWNLLATGSQGQQTQQRCQGSGHYIHSKRQKLHRELPSWIDGSGTKAFSTYFNYGRNLTVLCNVSSLW